MKNQKKQIILLFFMVLLYAILGFLTYALNLQNLSGFEADIPTEMIEIPTWQVGLLASAGIIVMYGIAGLAGLWFAYKLDLPGIYREKAGWKPWLIQPMIIGIILGSFITLSDRIFALAENWGGFSHPEFPLSLVASASAGIGEEILFRMFVLGFWAFLINLLIKRWKMMKAALWTGNIIAAFIFAAAHLPAMMYLYHTNDPFQLPVVVLVEIFVLNGILALVAGKYYLKDGLVAAVGIHFWTDIMWHVIFPPIVTLLLTRYFVIY